MASKTLLRHFHNEKVLRELKEGDMVEFPRGAYSHWGIYIGCGQIVHLAGEGGAGLNSDSGHVFTICGRQFYKAFVRGDPFYEVCGQSMAKKNNSKDRGLRPRSGQEIVKQALSMIGPIYYNVLWKNCEHFASFCRYGKEISEQAHDFWTALGVVALGVLGVFGVLGRVSGNSETEEVE